MTKLIVSILLLCVSTISYGFAPTPSKNQCGIVSSTKTTELCMANDEDLLRWARQSRSASDSDTVVDLMKPLGLILNEDDDGNVYVEKMAPKGNAARSGLVNEGDIVTMCSATFGNDMWSTRGVGLTRVLAAIRVRAGNSVKLVFESQTAYQKKAAVTSAQMEAMEEARQRAQAKKDNLLSELEKDEQKLSKKFFRWW